MNNHLMADLKTHLAYNEKLLGQFGTIKDAILNVASETLLTLLENNKITLQDLETFLHARMQQYGVNQVEALYEAWRTQCSKEDKTLNATWIKLKDSISQLQKQNQLLLQISKRSKRNTAQLRKIFFGQTLSSNATATYNANGELSQD